MTTEQTPVQGGATKEQIECPEHWSQADRLSDLHARYHGQTGNMLASDECGWERCDFWSAAEMTMDAVAEAALSVSGSADPADERHDAEERQAESEDHAAAQASTVTGDREKLIEDIATVRRWAITETGWDAGALDRVLAAAALAAPKEKENE